MDNKILWKSSFRSKKFAKLSKIFLLKDYFLKTIYTSPLNICDGLIIQASVLLKLTFDVKTCLTHCWNQCSTRIPWTEKPILVREISLTDNASLCCLWKLFNSLRRNYYFHYDNFTPAFQSLSFEKLAENRRQQLNQEKEQEAGTFLFFQNYILSLQKNWH